LHLELVEDLSVSAFGLVGGAISTAYGVWGISLLHALALEEKAHATNAFALPLAECRHQLLELGRPLDLEEHLIVVVSNLDVEVFRRLRLHGPFTRAVLVVIGHFLEIYQFGMSVDHHCVQRRVFTYFEYDGL
jgi:hypothetical protein